MFLVGSHISSAKGFLAMGRDAVRIGATALQFFLRNPRGGRAKALDPEDVAKFRTFADENGISHFLAHASYTLNPATRDDRLTAFFRDTASDDLARLELLPGAMYNLHPGSRKEQTPEEGAKTVAANLDAVMTAGPSTTVLLETMSGHGTEIGGTFEELAAIIDASENGARLGVCLDTCHVFSAGYDVVRELDKVLKRFDAILGLERLKAVHLNDSKFGPGSHKDRHAKLGEGELGWEAIGRIINHPKLHKLPFYLETPNDLDGYAAEIAALKTVYGTKAKGKTAGKKGK